MCLFVCVCVKVKKNMYIKPFCTPHSLALLSLYLHTCLYSTFLPQSRINKKGHNLFLFFPRSTECDVIEGGVASISDVTEGVGPRLVTSLLRWHCHLEAHELERFWNESLLVWDRNYTQTDITSRW